MLIAIALGINKILFVSKAISAEGAVIRIIEEKTEDGDIIFRPKVQFKTQNGETRTFIFLASFPSFYDVGDRVKVLYTEGQGRKAEIDSFITIWLVPMLIFIMASIFVGVSAHGLMKPRSGKPL